MAKSKKDKNPTFTFIKEFDVFNDGYKELSSLIPSVELYGGTDPSMEAVVASLTKTINENVPSPLNENYPNTFSFSINAREMGFLTDDSIAFGWRIFITKNDDSLVYQFRVTFTTLSVSKRKQIERLTSHGWKEKDLSDKQSRFWNEATASQRAAYREGNEDQESSTAVHESHVPSVHASTHNGNDQIPTASVDNSAGQASTLAKTEETVVQATQPLTVETTEPQTTVVESTIPNATKPVPTQVTISDSSQELARQQQSEQMEQNAMKNCSILPGGTAAVFIITHYGQQRVININDRNEGVYLDRASSTIKIGNVLYNYRKFQVRFLDRDYQHEQAQHVPAVGAMIEHPPVADEAFVGGKMVNENEADVPEHTIIPPPKPKLSPIQQKMLDQENKRNFNLIPPVQGQTQQPLKAGKTFVVDRTPKVPTDLVHDGVADQVVRVTDNHYGSNN